MITKKSVLYLSALALLLGSCARGTVSSNEVVPKLPKGQEKHRSILAQKKALVTLNISSHVSEILDPNINIERS